MPRRVQLPRELVEHPFRYADGIAAGMGEGRLRADDLERPFYGVRAPRVPNAEGLPDLNATLVACARFEPLLTPGRFFSHDTAARLWGCPLPDRASTTSVSVSARAPLNAPRGRGVRGRQSSDPRVGVVTRHGFPVSDAESTWLAMAPLVPFDELVVLADHLVLDPVVFDPRDPRPFASLASLAARIHGSSVRGALAARRALGLARVGAESRPETLLRLLLVRSGIPEPALNIPVTDHRGRTLGRGDLVWPEWRTVAEYDGDHHRTSDRQYDLDIRRIENFVAAGWRVIRVRKRGLFVTPSDTATRVRAALAAGGWESTFPRST